MIWQYDFNFLMDEDGNPIPKKLIAKYEKTEAMPTDEATGEKL